MHAAPRRTAVTVLLCAAFALGATACGPSSDDAKPAGPFGDLSGSQIVDKAFAATKGAKALTVDIDQRAAAEPIKAYLSLDSQGRCAGTLTTGATDTVELIKPDDKNVYMRFDEGSLREQVKDEDPETQKAVIKQLKGRWVKGSVSDPDNKDMLELCDPKQLLGGFEQGASGIEKGAETTVGGQKALALTEPGKGGESSTVYVATEGTPYVLRIVTKGGEDPGTITFSKYGKPAEAKAPAAKDVVETE
ncbi:hypothetical protein ACIGW4_22105 [Streptomyces sp. NPDC053513]|uniref:hypothetical protein n=1 Tax=unclassified Streptomyces TaxID=2593676 RepID=UPI000F46C7FD|nr:hypothetical protein [Streptomyces sp. PanSC19]ROQ24654.1 hypothetical protein EDD98_7266 [Streptomyces sp. PanSC19]